MGGVLRVLLLPLCGIASVVAIGSSVVGPVIPMRSRDRDAHAEHGPRLALHPSGVCETTGLMKERPPVMRGRAGGCDLEQGPDLNYKGNEGT